MTYKLTDKQYYELDELIVKVGKILDQAEEMEDDE